MSPGQGYTVWFTGLPCSGKTTLAHALATLLLDAGQPVEVLDGDVVRRELTRDLGFSRADRDANVRRIAFIANLLARHGVVVLVAVVSPYREARLAARQLLGRFVEVYVGCPLAECERRDAKGMYRRARAGEIRNFTGVDDPYEPPLAPDLEVDTSIVSVGEAVEALRRYLVKLGY